jgi:hypothetical protein
MADAPHSECGVLETWEFKSPRAHQLSGCSSVRTECPARNREVRGSNPRTPTIVCLLGPKGRFRSAGGTGRIGGMAPTRISRVTGPKGGVPTRPRVARRPPMQVRATPKGAVADGGGRRDDRDAVRKDVRRLDAKAGRREEVSTLAASRKPIHRGWPTDGRTSPTLRGEGRPAARRRPGFGTGSRRAAR